MATRTLILITALLAGMAAAVEPRIEWSFQTGGKIYASPIIADVDADGIPEVIVAASRARRLLCLNGQGEVKWDYGFEEEDRDGIQATPSVMDYDGDGKCETFFASRGGTVGCVDSQGRPIWHTFLDDALDYTGPVVTDLDGDGRVDVIVGGESGTLYCLDDCGMIKWRYQGDGAIRGIAATMKEPDSPRRRVYAVFGGGLEACFSCRGDLLWSHMEPSTRKERRSGPVIGDVDGDRQQEVVWVTDDFQVVARDAMTGAEKWRWAGNSRIDQTNSIALAHVDKLHLLDVFCADGTGQGGTGRVHRLSEGKLVWTADVGGGVVQGPSVGDVDGDGMLEVMVCSRSKRMICLSAADGTEKWSIPSDTEVLTTPALGDIDGDGQVEIVFTSKDGFVRCVTVDGAYNPDKLPWPMISRDPQLSGNAWNVGFTPPALSSPIDAAYLFVPEFGPIHIGKNVLECRINNNWWRPRRLEVVVGVLLPSGQVINRTVTGRFEPLESRDLDVEFPALYPGTYAMGYSVLDAGQGWTIATDQKEAELDPSLPVHRDELATRLGLPDIIGDLTAGPAQERMAAAADEAMRLYNEARAEAERIIQSEDASFSERQEAVARFEARLGELMRLGARAHALRLTPGEGLEFAVTPISPMEKVFRDEPALMPYIAGMAEVKPASMSLCGNEYESIQLAVVPVLKDVAGLRLSLAGPLIHQNGEGSIAPENVAIYRVGYVDIAPPEYSWAVRKVGAYPDVLFPAEPVDVPAGQDAQPYFVTVRADAGTPAGDYSGVVRVEADGCPAVEIPLQVRVYGFHIAKETHLKTSFWMNEGFISKFYGFEGRPPFDVRKRFYDMHFEHRLSPVKDFPLEGGDMLEDFEYLMGHGQNCFFIPLPASIKSEERDAFAERLRATRDLLVQKGWNDYAMFYCLDEIAVMQRDKIPEMVETSQWVKTIIPEWPRLETSAPEIALLGAVDIWCPTVDHYDPLLVRQRLEQGDRLWLYTVWGRPGIMIECPSTDYRTMFWQTRAVGGEGFLYWGTTHWDLNCVGEKRWPEVPWITYNRQPGHNGCGYLIYPGPDATPLASVRLSLVRDGIEDYEYFHLLSELLKEVGDKLPQDLYQQALNDTVPPTDVFQGIGRFTEDPAIINRFRDALAETIEKVWACKEGSAAP